MLNIEYKKYKNLYTKFVTTSPGLPYIHVYNSHRFDRRGRVYSGRGFLPTDFNRLHTKSQTFSEQMLEREGVGENQRKFSLNLCLRLELLSQTFHYIPLTITQTSVYRCCAPSF